MNGLLIALYALLTMIFLVSLFNTLTAPMVRKGPQPRRTLMVSLLVPARDEEHTIARCLESLCAQEYSELEIIILDDHSQDRTTAIVPVVPLVANVLARPISDPAEIRTRLVEQVTGTVRWRESIEWLSGEGVDTFVEIGAGKVLSGMVKRIAKDASGLAVNVPGDVDAVLEKLNG